MSKTMKPLCASCGVSFSAVRKHSGYRICIECAHNRNLPRLWGTDNPHPTPEEAARYAREQQHYDAQPDEVKIKLDRTKRDIVNRRKQRYEATV